MEKFVCEECGSENVWTKCWRQVNGSLVEETGDDFWCDDCEEHVNITTKREFERETLNLLRG